MATKEELVRKWFTLEFRKKKSRGATKFRREIEQHNVEHQLMKVM